MSVKNTKQLDAADRFIAASKGLREAIGADIPLQQVMILAYLFRHRQCNQIELVRALDFKVAAASRHCKSLSSYNVQVGDSLEQRGQQLILAKRNPVATREMRYSLTDRTRSFMATFMATLAGST